MSDEKVKEERTWTEEIEVLGHELVNMVKNLVAEGNVRKLIVRTPEGQVLIELPLTAGFAVGGVVTLMAPVLAALGALAALLARAKVEIVRTGEPKPDQTSKAGNETPTQADEGPKTAAGA